jgi:hypothetical protein
MKRRMVAPLVVAAVLSLSLATQAGAAGHKSPEQAARGWLDRAISWLSKTLQPVLTGIDSGGCIDPHGGATCG